MITYALRRLYFLHAHFVSSGILYLIIKSQTCLSFLWARQSSLSCKFLASQLFATEWGRTALPKFWRVRWL